MLYGACSRGSAVVRLLLQKSQALMLYVAVYIVYMYIYFVNGRVDNGVADPRSQSPKYCTCVCVCAHL